mmetsp:Transcript_21516/g.39462  ORF Transcript_21516/g.39462 Transcript_21516/m.39462 type:complete len:429 (+) Transcript_21516:171-1457(+)
MSFNSVEGLKLVVNAKNTFLEIEEEMQRQGNAGQRSASCPPLETPTANTVNTHKIDDEIATFEKMLQKKGERPRWADAEDNAWGKALFCPPSPGGGSTRTPSSTSSSRSSPRRPLRGRKGNKTEFAVTLDKRQGGTHGIDIDWSNGEHLLIEKVNSPGLIAKWNEEHPDRKIVAGHCIVEVNGIRGDAEELLEEMKRNTMLELQVQPPQPPQPPKKQREQRADHSRTKVRAANPQRTPLRTALKSQAPLFQPGSATSPAWATGVAMDSTWTAPKGAKAEFMEAVQELYAGLCTSVPAEWSMDVSDPTLVSFSAPTSFYSGAAVVSATQQAILSIVAKFPTVFLMGRNVNPFHTLSQGRLGFQVDLCAVSKDRFTSTCWDTVSRGYCQRGCACKLEPPSDLMKVQIVLEPTEQMMCVPSFEPCECQWMN